MNLPQMISTFDDSKIQQNYNVYIALNPQIVSTTYVKIFSNDGPKGNKKWHKGSEVKALLLELDDEEELPEGN